MISKIVTYYDHTVEQILSNELSNLFVNAKLWINELILPIVLVGLLLIFIETIVQKLPKRF